ncbi:hypothetical protein N0V95_003522 [Ascochyta clinopodiicola]|nr:hypothetical protein N0V95_003522 [Ascochyta clinopodiicola]
MAPYARLILKHDTLEDQTSRVSPDGHASLTFPAGRARGSQYCLFAFYERLTHHRNLAVESVEMKTIFGNGSYVVDHFSAKGAETVINFWHKHILSDDLLALIAKVGNYAWEDSVEIKSNISWTLLLPVLFEKEHGYDYTQQTGKLFVDVVYDKQSAIDLSFASASTNLADLIENGYSFNYISPENFELPEAYVENRTLALNGPAYKA